MRFALEHFGTGRDSQRLISTLPLDFVKIDGSLMQGLAGSPELQQRVRAIAALAQQHNVQTVAERIEDANTMAVVWQLGVQFIQGYLVHAPGRGRAQVVSRHCARGLVSGLCVALAACSQQATSPATATAAPLQVGTAMAQPRPSAVRSTTTRAHSIRSSPPTFRRSACSTICSKAW